MAILLDENGTERIDKWLNLSCLFKTRAQAAKACEERKVKMNGETIKPAKTVKKGDVITIRNKNGQFTNYTVLGVVHKNVKASDAKLMYEKEEIELSDEAKELIELYDASVKIDRGKYKKGRPTKKERRKMDKAKRSF